MQGKFSGATENLDTGRKLDDSDPTVAARYQLNDIFCNAWLSHAVTAAVEHRIPDFIFDGTSYTEVAARAKVHAPTLYRLLRGLAANGIFRELPDGRFEHTDVSQLLRTDHQFSWSGMARMWDHPSCLQGWQHFRDCLKDGKSGIEHAFGKTLYEHLGERDDLTKAFSDAMIANSAHPAESIALQFPFSKFNTVMDIGGGCGTLLLTLLRAHPHLKGIIYELPELEPHAKQCIAEQNLGDRCEFVSGDFLTSIPSGADLYLVKNSLWNWQDDKCLAILKNIRQAIATTPGARFLLIEYIIDQRNSRWTTVYDLQILNMTGGRARTESEYRDLLVSAGFKVEETKIVEDQSLWLTAPV